MTGMSVTMLAALLFGISLAVSAHVMDVYAADETAPKCKTAEVNPVTGHVFCIGSLGAEVAPPPADPCKHDRDDADWTWQPSCAEKKRLLRFAAHATTSLNFGMPALVAGIHDWAPRKAWMAGSLGSRPRAGSGAARQPGHDDI